ncbi:MAG: carboxypeptidase-like regulatory domain-containing protein [Chitinophagales bacterium]
MSEEKKYKNYSAVDIEKYHKGLLSPKEMNELEKAALDDPFLAEAFEGYGTVAVNISKDLSDLEKRLKEKIAGAKVVDIIRAKKPYKWWKVAVAVIIIGGIGFLTFRISTNNKKDSSIARLQEKRSIDSIQTRFIDSPVTPNKSANQSKTSKREITPVAGVNRTAPTSIKGSFNEKTADSLFDTKTNSEAAVMTKTETPVTLNESQQKKDSTDNKKVSPGYSSLFSKTKKLRNDDKQVEESSASADVFRSGDEQRMNYFRGRIVDADNTPLPFANITSTKYNVGTYADAQGNFTLISPDSVLGVQVHSVGFENKSAILENNVGDNRITMQEDKTLPEKIISYQKPDTSRSHNGSMKFEEPEPVDGWINYNIYLVNNINVPGDLKLKQDNAQVKVSFEINPDGDPANIRVEKSLCQKCDEEAIRLIRQGPKWKKGTKKIKRINVTVPFDRNQ